VESRLSQDQNQPLDPEALRASQFSDISSGLNGALDSIATSGLKKRQLFIAFMIFVVTNAADQLAKQVARTELAPFQDVSYLGGWLRFHHSENPGAFLSLGAQFGANMRFGVFTILVVAFLIWATWMLIKKAGHANMMFVLGWALLISGGFANVIDRAVKGTVTDFMVMGQGAFTTGVFNIADMAIMFGILIVLFFGRETQSRGPMSR
jgi:signal peptidase II